MSRDARLDLDWADGTYAFRLGWGELELLQEACDAGPYVVLGRLTDGTWRMQDVAETIRCGLIGGGMSTTDAVRKVRTYVKDRPPAESLMTAQAVLSAGLVGAPDEQLGKPEAATEESSLMLFPTASFGSPPSTDPEPRQDSALSR
ncbi:gene transfer agent family protein [Xanthobacteraceae bacterium A53D]